MIYAAMAILALLPTIVIGGAAGVARLVLGPRVPALQVALWLSALSGAAYAGWMVIDFYRDTNHRNVAVGSVVFLALPLFAGAVALLVFGYAWGVGTVAVEGVRLAHGTAGVGGAVARCVLPVLGLLVAVYFTAVVVTPSDYDRVRRVRSADGLTPLYDRALRDNDIGMLQTLANSELLPPEKLAELGGHAHPWVRGRVAFNRHTPAATLARLAEDTDVDVQTSLVGNDAVPDEVLERMAVRDDRGGRAAADALRVRRATTRPATSPATGPASAPN